MRKQENNDHQSQLINGNFLLKIFFTESDNNILV